MRFSEFGSGSTFNVQNMNVFVLPSEDDSKEVINPGIEYGKDGKAKWSPPLQQNLDVMKDAVGTTTDDVTVKPNEEEIAKATSNEKDSNLDRLKQLVQLFNKSQSFPSG